jgi:hypothetical protein
MVLTHSQVMCCSLNLTLVSSARRVRNASILVLGWSGLSVVLVTTMGSSFDPAVFPGSWIEYSLAPDIAHTLFERRRTSRHLLSPAGLYINGSPFLGDTIRFLICFCRRISCHKQSSKEHTHMIFKITNQSKLVIEVVKFLCI